jgi:hypothetical protein
MTMGVSFFEIQQRQRVKKITAEAIINKTPIDIQQFSPF